MCLVSFAGATLIGGLNSCASSNIYEANSDNGELRVPINRFDSGDRLLVRTNQVGFDLLLLRHSATEFEAFLLECTHQNNPLTLSGTRLFCSAHGSQFDLHGNVLLGPAATPLHHYKTVVVGDEVVIDLRG